MTGHLLLLLVPLLLLAVVEAGSALVTPVTSS
jgi:hypothetical protein